MTAGEIALLDAREEGVFARRHLLLASCVPLGPIDIKGFRRAGMCDSWDSSVEVLESRSWLDDTSFPTRSGDGLLTYCLGSLAIGAGPARITDCL